MCNADYKAPLRDIQFVINEVLDTEALYQSLPGYEEATPDLMNAIIEEGAKFAENVLSPLNQSGDEEGCPGVKTASRRPKASPKRTSSTWRTAGRRCPPMRSSAARACPTCSVS
jgi:hypothetical protein